MLIVVFITVIVVEIYYWPWCQVRLTFVLKPLECRLHHYNSYPLMSYGENPPVCMSIVICNQRVTIMSDRMTGMIVEVSWIFLPGRVTP